ncbi:hypothetical protein M3Y98_01213300 [Aphelenchoides besseyi]|nr:hypothetical protein M3Y98_01213300 [Aphelenchoides besseyi]KAI6193181.1 hypothetical protein M3Y96_00991200 [Aphelenchoides besseyi]
MKSLVDHWMFFVLLVIDFEFVETSTNYHPCIQKKEYLSSSWFLFDGCEDAEIAVKWNNTVNLNIIIQAIPFKDTEFSILIGNCKMNFRTVKTENNERWTLKIGDYVSPNRQRLCFKIATDGSIQQRDNKDISMMCSKRVETKQTSDGLFTRLRALVPSNVRNFKMRVYALDHSLVEYNLRWSDEF